ncbi:MAG: hypothetical protein PVS2B3_09680 [Steroidobacteraceae bacterium]
MKALRQLGFLKLSLRADGTPEEDHRVLALFRNRAELKKAYGDLQEEIYRLQDLVKQQEGASQRALDMLNTLEGRLGVTESAYPALVFYQLRRLWQAGRDLITQFVSDLVRQQEERERRAHLAHHNRRLFARRSTAAEQLRVARALAAEAAGAVAALEARRTELDRFWHYFRRRHLEGRVTAAHAAAAAAGSTLDLAQRAAEELEREAAPQFPGLSLAARRAINIAARGYAQVLCLRLAEIKTPLLEMARDATGRREVSDDYGSPRECVLLMGEIQRAHRLLERRDNLAAEIKLRTAPLSARARYRGPGDTTPSPDSLDAGAGDVLQEPARGSSGTPLPNVLSEDTWDLFRVLLR